MIFENSGILMIIYLVGACEPAEISSPEFARLIACSATASWFSMLLSIDKDSSTACKLKAIVSSLATPIESASSLDFCETFLLRYAFDIYLIT